MAQTFRLTSPAFADGGIMPERFACHSDNVSPTLDIGGIPRGTASLALIFHDPDAPYGDFIHWTVWDIPPSLMRLPEDNLPRGVRQGTNDFGHQQYDGPCPPSGEHRYKFDLYALDASLALDQGAPEEDVRLRITEHAIAKTTLTGRFAARALA